MFNKITKMEKSKNILGWLFLVLLLSVGEARAAEYGDLYNVKWCPCNPDEQFNSQGSVVMGRTVMCPCESMYDGYSRTFEKDVRAVQDKAERALDKAKAYKYYVGIEYNKSQVETNHKKINFNDPIFSPANGVNIDSSQMIDHQDNIGVVLGFRPHKNWGMEAFYNRAYAKNEVTQYDDVNISSTDYHLINTYVTKYQAFGVDLVGYLPVTQFFDFVAFVGIGKYQFDNSARFEARYLEGGITPAVYTANYSFDEDEIGYRVGGGVQFNVMNGVVLRLMYKYINIGSDTIHYLQEYSASLRFLF